MTGPIHMSVNRVGRRNKFRAKAVVVGGERFDSEGEYGRWCELRLQERAGQISNLERQKVFPLEIDDKPVLIRSKGYPNGRRAKYTADFVYFQGNERVIEDFKGYDTAESRLRRAVVEAIYNVRITVTGRRGKVAA